LLHKHRLIQIVLAVFVCAAVAGCDGDDHDGASTSTVAPTAAATPSPGASPAITIDAPEEGALLTIPFQISGAANVFEGALEVEAAVDGADDGFVYCRHHVQATSDTGTPGTWSTTMAFAFPHVPETDAPVVIRAYSLSAADGSVQDLVERSVRVSGEQPDIVVTSPGCSEEVEAGSTITVTGMALVFEAVLQVGVRDASGAELIRERVMAASGTEFSPWSTNLDLSLLPGAGIYEIVAYDFSARDGSIENEFPIPIVVR
jgi:hypothetical protein